MQIKPLLLLFLLLLLLLLLPSPAPFIADATTSPRIHIFVRAARVLCGACASSSSLPPSLRVCGTCEVRLMWVFFFSSSSSFLTLPSPTHVLASGLSNDCWVGNDYIEDW